MKKIIACLFLASIARADIQADGANIFTSDTRTLNVSTVLATPTQILTEDSFITRTWIVNNSSFTVLLSTVSTGFNSGNGGTFQLPPCVTNTSCLAWSPDGPMVPYWGQMFAVQLGTGTSTVPTLSVLREK